MFSIALSRDRRAVLERTARPLASRCMRAVIIGCGAVTENLYAGPLRRLERQGLCRVVGLVDPDRVRTGVLRRKLWRSKARLYEDVADGLAAEEPNIVFVLSPAHLHVEHAVAALLHGSHVLCEKPMARNSAECDRMNEAASANKRVLAIGMVRRFFPSYHQLKQLVASGTLGTIRSFSYQEGRRFDWNVRSAAGFRSRDNGGAGVLLDIGPHALDLLTWCFGVPSQLRCSDDALEGIAANVVIDANFGGIKGCIQLSWDTPLANELRIVGSNAEAVLRLDPFDKLAMIQPDGRIEEVRIGCKFAADLRASRTRSIQPRIYSQAIYCQLVQFLRAICLGESPAVDGVEASNCVASLQAVSESSRPMEMNWLSAGCRQSFNQIQRRNR